MSKETIIKEGKLIMTKYESAKEFFCDRCQQNKKSKNIAEWQTTNNENKTICNGCHGFMLSQQ